MTNQWITLWIPGGQEEFATGTGSLNVVSMGRDCFFLKKFPAQQLSIVEFLTEEWVWIYGEYSYYMIYLAILPSGVGIFLRG